MKVILIIVGAITLTIIILIVIALVVGSRLPQHHVTSRLIRLGGPPSEVYATVRDFEASARWRPGVQSVEMLGTVDGRVRFREHGTNNTVTYELVEDVPNQRIVTRIVDRDLGYSGSWTYVFTPTGGGTVMRVTENGEVSSPMFRFMSRYVFGHAATIDTYLKSVAGHFGETALPEDADGASD